ncbi:TonB-dependent receptor [Phenylobacterium sp.]|uniref:TonB-dependent receptor n=1 Tax=Phenylobacterium sp. TaxID=1871053 RepID=UPI0025EBDB8D|nr:TonB-dependent receptor [Phenylobacterium sp.]
MRSLLTGLFASGSIAALALASPTIAHAADDADAAGQLQEVIVTATRRPETLQKVPQSVAVIGEAQLRQSGAHTFTDVGFSSANVMTANGVGPGSFQGVVIRGIQNRTGVYVDDVLIPNTQAQNVQIIDAERIEILRGPQGTTFGANTLAGAVNTVTKRPSFTWTGDAEASYGSDNRREAHGYISGPLAKDLLAFKASAFVMKRDGFDTDAEGKELPTLNSRGVRGALLFTPTEQLSIQLSGDYQRDKPIIDDYYLYNPATNSHGSRPSTQNFPGTDLRKVYGGQLRADYDFGNNIKLVSITAQRWSSDMFDFDGDYTPAQAFNVLGPVKNRAISQEFRLLGGDDKLSWLIGAFYNKSTLINAMSYSLGPDFETSPGVPLRVSSGLTRFITQTRYDRLESRGKAVFGSVNWRFAPDWKLTLGGRYSDTTANDHNFVARNYTSPAAPVGPLTTLPSIKDSRFTPAVSLSYDIAPSIMVYGTVGTGFQTGGYNGAYCASTSVNASLCQYRPEKLTSYEAGLKSFMFDRRLMLNVAIFDQEYKDLQRQQYVNITGTTFGYVINNASSAVSRGVEADFKLQVNRSFWIDGSAGYEDAHYKKFPNASIRISTTQSAIMDLSGRSLPFAPKRTGSVAGNYTGTTELGTYLLRAEIQHRSPYVNSDSPFELYDIKPQTNLNLSAQFTFNNGAYVAVRGRNVLNQRYVLNQSGSPSIAGQFFVAVAEPAFVWGEVGFHF